MTIRRHQYRTIPAPAAPVVHDGPLSIKVSAGYGRLYVGGPNYRIALPMPGATINERRQVIELSLTLESIRALKKLTGLDAQAFARFCTPDVLAYAKAAAQVERDVTELHEKLSSGFRLAFPWADNKYETGLISTYRAPFDHQAVMATAACSIDGLAFLCEMGTGKSRAGAEALAYKLSTGAVDIGIVVCPRGVIGTWKREFAQWTVGVNVIPLIDMPVKDRIAALRAASAPAHRQPNTVFVVNYDVLDSMKEAIDGLFTQGVKVGIVLDEMHRIRNPQTKTAKAVLALTPYFTWRLGMTGTSVLQGAHDVWSQWYFVDLGVTFGANYVQFKREFFDDDPWTFKTMPKPGALDEIGARLRRRGIRYTKAECLDLPPKIYTTMEVEMTREQQRAYDEMEAQLVAILSGERVENWEAFDPERTDMSSAANQLAAMLRLTQVTSGFLPVDGGKGLHFFTPNPKLDTLEEIVEEAIEEQQVVVWARYRADHDMIMQRLAPFTPKLIRGGVSQADRDDIETGFQDGRYRLIVAQPGAGGVGLNFWRGSLAIYYSQSYSLEHRMQSEDRTHRAGSEMHSKVTYIDLVAKNSVDLIVSAALRDKKDVADVVVDLKKILGVNA